MEIIDYILQERLILIPALYALAEIIKTTELVKNKYIPSIVLFFGVLLSLMMGGLTMADNIIQGILVAGATVLTNQIIKQSQKEE